MEVFVLDLDWDEFKTEIIAKGYPLNHKANNNGGYEVFAVDRGTLIYRAVINDSADITEFETLYKANSNRCIYDDYGKQYVRSGSRPLDKTTYFCMIGDSASNIGDGTELSWNFANDNDLIISDSNIKRKRVEFTFIDDINIKEGTIYWMNAPFGSYIDLKVVCPAGAYYLANDKTPRYAAVDTPIDHFVSHHMLIDNCPMGDELNTEEASMEIPNYFKYWLEITVPVVTGIENFKGFASLEIYRPRTVVLA